MICIRLHPDLIETLLDGSERFKLDSEFAGMDIKRTVLHIGSGKQEGNVIKTSPDINHEHGDTGCFLVDKTGTCIDDIDFESLMKDVLMYNSYGNQIILFAKMGRIEVSQDGTALTVAQMKAFVAP